MPPIALGHPELLASAAVIILSLSPVRRILCISFHSHFARALWIGTSFIPMIPGFMEEETEA